jgi:hypothetical protein
MIALPRHPRSFSTEQTSRDGLPHSSSGAAAGAATGTVLVVAAVYLVWAVATYLLEGAQGTLLKPDDRAGRLAYALVSNVLAGTLLPLWTLRTLAAQGAAAPRLAPFANASSTALGVGVAGTFILFMLLPLAPVAKGATAYLNGFAHVVPTSIAEVLVCWVLVGAAVDASLGAHNAVTAGLLKWVAGATLFAVYHFAHSPPYNTWAVVAFLGGVGLVTGGYFLVSGELYGTILLQCGFATVGVVASMSEAGALPALRSPQPVLYVTAVASVAVLVALDALWFRSGGPESVPVRSATEELPAEGRPS